MSRSSSISVIFSILAAGCCPCRHLPQATAIRDSLAVRVVDSTVVHIDTVRVAIPQESSSAVTPAADTSHLETSVAESDAWMDPDGRLHHSLRNKAAELLLPLPVPEHFRTVAQQRGHTEQIIRQVEVPRQLTRWQKFLIRSGGLSWLILIIVLVGWLIFHSLPHTIKNN